MLITSYLRWSLSLMLLLCGAIIAAGLLGALQDNPVVTYIMRDNRNYDIAVMDIVTGVRHNLTASPENNLRFTWSPDGQQIAFRAGGGDSETGTGLYVMNARGRDLRRLADDGSTPRWSPDGEWIAYQYILPNHRTDLFIVPATGGEPLRLTDVTGVSDREPTWSPDSTRLVFSRRRTLEKEVSTDLFSVHVQSRQATALTGADRFGYHYPVWSGVGDQIAYERGSFGNSGGLFIMSDGGDNRRNLPPGVVSPPVNPRWGQNIAWAPDSAYIAFPHLDGGIALWHLETDDILLFPCDCKAYYPDWSTDGSLISFVSGNGIWILDVATGDYHDLRSWQDSPVLYTAWRPG